MEKIDIEDCHIGMAQSCSSLMLRRIREDLRNIQLRIVRMDDSLWTNNTRQILINTTDEFAININETNQTNPRYNTNSGRLWIHTISQIFQYFAISATTLYDAVLGRRGLLYRLAEAYIWHVFCSLVFILENYWKTFSNRNSTKL